MIFLGVWMKKLVGKMVILSAVVGILGIVGRMDYEDQQFDAANTKEILSRATHLAEDYAPSNSPPTPPHGGTFLANSSP